MKTIFKLCVAVLFLPGIATVCPAQVTLTISPGSPTVIAGGPVTFFADISSSGYCSGDYAGQWQHDGTNLLNIITTVAGDGTSG
jgi:hypothetical protein